jgi:hypothetical protein
MNPTRTLLVASALLLGTVGVAASFLPDEILRWSGAPSSPVLALLVQVLGALYLGLGMLNWMVRDTLLGGIYGRPVVMANVLHWVPAAFACVKLVARMPGAGMLWPVALVYAAFALAFALVMFRHPAGARGPIAMPA